MKGFDFSSVLLTSKGTQCLFLNAKSLIYFKT